MIRRAGAAALSLCLGVTFAPAGADAAALTMLDNSAADSLTKLFTTEVKRDQVVPGGGGSGRDVFLRNNVLFTGPNQDFAWGSSGSQYDWLLEYDGDQATFTFDSLTPLTLDVDPDGDWGAIRFFIQADSDLLSNEKTTVTVDSVNGMAVSETLSAMGNKVDTSFVISGASNITSIGGTLQFDFDVNDGVNGSPQSRLGFSLKALSAPAPVPVPAALPLLGTALVGAGLLGWRKRKSA